MSLDGKDIAMLSRFLVPENVTHQSLESLNNSFQHQFSKNDRLKLCHVLSFILEYDLIYNTTSKFVSLYFIWEMCKSELNVPNPFVVFLVEYLQNMAHDSKLPISAINMLYDIMKQPDHINKYLRFNSLQIFNLPNKGKVEMLDWKFNEKLTEGEKHFTKMIDSSIVGVVPDSDISQFHNKLYHSKKKDSSQFNLKSDVEDDFELFRMGRLSDIRPELMTIAPPLLPCFQAFPHSSTVPDDGNHKPDVNCAAHLDELIWLNPFTIWPEFHWSTNTKPVNLTTELRQLISTVMTSALTQQQQQTVVQALKSNPNLVYNLGISPEVLSNLVDRNPVIAIDVLELLISPPNKQTDYLNALLNMEINVQSLEVVNRLTTKIQLSMEFIRDYIFKCLSSCYTVRDQFHQMRHVRLVCVLLQSLIRNNILDLHDQNILVEVRTFCLEFTKVREANTLYRLISNLKNSGTM